MKLKKFLKICKSRSFSVFVYPVGHVKECRGTSENTISFFYVSRDDNGVLVKSSDYSKYANAVVTEVIPFANFVNVVVEVPND